MMSLLFYYFIVIIISISFEQNTSTDCSSKYTCEDCLSLSSTCFWCNGDKPKCLANTEGSLFPFDKCAFSGIRMKYCWVNYEALVISLAVVSVLIIIIIFTTLYCCCRRARRSALRNRVIEDDLTEITERTEREERNAQRRMEHNSRYDEIRMKYGLPPKNGTPTQYSRFENERD